MSVKITECLQQWRDLFGFQKSFLSYQGPQFTTVVTQKWLEDKGMQQRFFVPYSPEANRVSERINAKTNNVFRLNKGQRIKVTEKQNRNSINLSFNRNTLGSPFVILNGFGCLDRAKCQIVITLKSKLEAERTTKGS